MGKSREYKVKTERILNVAKHIRDMNYPSSTVIAKLEEVHPVTIRHDVDFLRDRYHAPIAYDKRKKGYYYTDKSFNISDVLLTESEVFAITTMLPLMEQYKNTPLESSFKSVFDKISELLPKEQIDVNLSFIDEVQFIADPTPSIEPAVFTKVFKAIRERKNLICHYKSSRNKEYKIYSLDPYKIVCYKATWYVYAYCNNHQEYRIFSLSRFQECEIEKEFFFREDYEEHFHIDQYFGIWNNNADPAKIELLFDPSTSAYVTEREWHPEQECIENEDGSVYLTFKTNQEQKVINWILSFGPSVKILNPPELREKVKTALLSAAEQYK